MGKKKLARKKKAGPPKFTVTDAGVIDVIEVITNEDLLSTFGTDDNNAFTILLSQLIETRPGYDSRIVNGTVSMVADIAPQNGLEGMLAVQMVTAHNLAMSMAARAMLPDQTTEGVNDNITRVNKMMKTFVSQTEALAKLRGNTKTVTIKHVNVSEGGQAIIGDVHHGGTDEKK